MKLSFTLARMVATALLIWALAPNSSGYYQVLRIAVSAVCVLGVYCANRWNQHGWIFAFGWLAILFNPLYPVSLPDFAWAMIDIAVAATMLASLFLLKPRRKILEPAH